jgi:large subunit ribosomal protein L2
MALITFKPTSPGRRSMVRVSTAGLHKGGPLAALVEKKSKTGGRNNNGRITTRHIGGGHKQAYRLIDFKRDKEGVPARVERIEYDPNRTGHIALLCYADGERRYIIAPKGLQAGDQLIAGKDAPIKAGNALPLRNMPLGSTVHCIEMKPGKGAQLARAAGAGAQLVTREGGYATLRLRSGEMRKVPVDCYATIGEVGNVEHSLETRLTIHMVVVKLAPDKVILTQFHRGARQRKVTRRAITSALRNSSSAIVGVDAWHVHLKKVHSSITILLRRSRRRVPARSRSKLGRAVQ